LAADIDEVLDQLRSREAEKKEVERAAKEGDQVTVDFAGVDAKTKEPVKGADGKAYPLTLGSDAFIPGFEPELIGLKAGDEKSFDITFPADYGVSALQNRTVTFTVIIHRVFELTQPTLDDAFAAKVGPFTKLDELKEDIKKQLTAERETQAQRAYEEQVLNKVAEESEVAIPDSLIDSELDRMDAEERRNLAYRGQTWQEHLDAEGITEEDHRKRNREQAERRVKAGLVLSEIANQEKIDVSGDELQLRLQLLKGQYQDKTMQAELDKPENQRDIASRILTEKTVAKLVGYASKS
jgi:trigger factor